MVKVLLSILFVFVSAQDAMSTYTLEDVSKFKNDKEAFISSFSSWKRKKILKKFPDPEVIKGYENTFYEIFLNFLNSSKRSCELRLISEIHEGLRRKEIANSEDEIEDFLKALRTFHAIDDIFYEILSSANKDYFGLKNVQFKKVKRKNLDQTETDIESLYEGFKEFPDEETRCLYREYNNVLNNIRDEEGKKTYSLKDFKRLTTKAYHLEVISLETYHKLRYLHSDSPVNEQKIWLNDYIRIILNAKNQMTSSSYSYEVRNIEDESKFSSEKLKRFSKITRRKRLYRKYDETQIILLAQVLKKASQRMGVDPDTETQPPFISQEFTITNPDGQRKTYVEVIELDPQSQYNLARRLLRKDMVELQMMDTFLKHEISHEDVVMAALETGYISLEELEFVIQYDDLWNPERTKFERIKNFIFTIAGYSTFFLPPPWNITASIALGVVEGVIDDKYRNGAENDNPATFIE